MRRFPVSVVVVPSSLLFHSIGEMSDTIQIAATLPPTATGRPDDDGERGKRRRRLRAPPTPFSRSSFMRSAIFGPFIHSFGQSAPQPACSIRGPPAHNGSRTNGRSSVTSCCKQCRDLKWIGLCSFIAKRMNDPNGLVKVSCGCNAFRHFNVHTSRHVLISILYSCVLHADRL